LQDEAFLPELGKRRDAALPKEGGGRGALVLFRKRKGKRRAAGIFCSTVGKKREGEARLGERVNLLPPRRDGEFSPPLQRERKKRRDEDFSA